MAAQDRKRRRIPRGRGGGGNRGETSEERKSPREGREERREAKLRRGGEGAKRQRGDEGHKRERERERGGSKRHTVGARRTRTPTRGAQGARGLEIGVDGGRTPRLLVHDPELAAGRVLQQLDVRRGDDLLALGTGARVSSDLANWARKARRKAWRQRRQCLRVQCFSIWGPSRRPADRALRRPRKNRRRHGLPSKPKPRSDRFGAKIESEPARTARVQAKLGPARTKDERSPNLAAPIPNRAEQGSNLAESRRNLGGGNTAQLWSNQAHSWLDATQVWAELLHLCSKRARSVRNFRFSARHGQR